MWKDIFNTIKNELRGPEIYSVKLNKPILKIKQAKLNRINKINNIKLSNEIKIIDNNLLEKNCKVKSGIASCEVNSSNGVIKLQDDIVTNTNKIFTNLKVGDINNVDLTTIWSGLINILNKNIEIISTVLDGKQKIFKISKTIYNNFEKYDREKLLNNVGKDYLEKNYVIGVFSNIEFENIYNLSYNENKNILKVYLKEKQEEVKNYTLIILKNIETKKISKIII